ncbi:MAG: O-methyltransferase [Micrococcaceae bacterium]
MDERWKAVDEFLEQQLIVEPAACRWVRQIAHKEGMPPIEVTALQGKFLAMLVQSISSKRVLELGTLAGYSTAWLADALKESGVVHTVESRQAHVDIAQKSFQHPDLKDKVILHHGRATQVLQQMVSEHVVPFDFVFIDADKASYPQYLELALELTHDGSIIVMDNTIRQGSFLEDVPERKVSIHGLKKLYQKIKEHPELNVTALQTVGAKGWDGFLMIQR